MPKTIVTCDSTIAITNEVAKEYGLRVLPLNVIVDNVEYHDRVDIDADELAKKMRAGATIKTSTPTPYEIENFFDQLFEEGYEKIVHFTISSKLSSMFDLFTNLCKEKYGDKVIVVDSKAVMNFMLCSVLNCKQLIEEKGYSAEDAAKETAKHVKDFDVVFIPESLTFLKRGGRVSPAVAILGNLIGLKPILSFNDGALEKYGTTRNIKATLKETAMKFAEQKRDPKVYDVSVVGIDTNPALLDFGVEMAHQYLPEFNVVREEFSVNVEAHAGPGTIGIVIRRKFKQE